MGSKFGGNKFKSQNKAGKRTENIRDEHKVQGERKLICFSLKDIDRSQIPSG